MRAPFNQEQKTYIEKLSATAQIPQGVKLIGAPIRGSDLGKRFYGHAIQATTDEMLALLEERLQTWKEPGEEISIFVNSEEQRAIDCVKAKFPQAYCTDSVRFVKGESDGVMRVADLYQKLSKYENIQQYLTNIWLLSRCDSLIGSMNNGYYTAIIWNGGKFSHLETIDKGRYK